MTSFGRLTAAVFAGVVESTQALANVNFDFSLIKVEAPQEFHGVGHALTAHRRAEAEDGSIHITARRLGAIFESLLPPTPNLLKAYGLRASEIGKSCAADSRKEPGMFAEQIGIDATTIWAAATSGSGAIQAHLLACMLARIWDGPEAISIWVELLECRRTEVRNKFEETGSVDMSTLMAVRQQLSRAQLAEWDASARAWLRIADNAKALQQKQLLLIIGNLTTLVNAKPHFYQNVVESWKAGLEGMERLLQGSPLQMQSGELLLGLSAWHLYPDLMVLDPATHLVRQRDALVPDSGILTLGLEMSDISHSEGLKSKGLHWSLPLAHLRYYGDPVRCSAVIGAQGSRLSIYEFHQAVLGCLLGGWNVMDSEIEAVIHWVSHLSTLFNEAVTSVSYGAVTSTSHNAIFSWHKHKGSWLSLLGRTARSFLDSVAVERRKNTQLVNLGRRHASFLGKPALPYFGLLEIERVIKLAKGQETKIQLLRALAASCQVSKRSLIIRYVSDETGREEFATAVPCDREPLKRTASQSSKKSSGHLRWVHSKPVYYADKEFDESVPFKDVYFGYVEPGDTTSEPKPPVSTVDRITQVRADFNAQKAKYEAAGEQTLAVEDEPLKIVERMNEKIRVVWGEVEQNSGLSDFDPWFGEVKHYELCLGDPSSAGLFARMKHHRPELPKQMPINQLQLLFRNRMLDFDLFPELLCQSLMSLGRDHLLSLKAIALMDKAYMEATHSTVDVRVLQSPLDSVSWTQDIDEQRFDIYDEERELPYARPTAKVNNKGTESEASDNTPTVSDREGEARLQDHDQDDDSRGHDEDVSDNEDAGGPTSPGYFNDAIGSPPQQGASPQRTAISSNFLRHCILESLQRGAQAARKCYGHLERQYTLYCRPLLSDPAPISPRSEIRHVMGNIGRPGTVLLVPPVAPRIRSLDIEQWNLLNLDDWDGQSRDCFSDSSLHLWFTGATVPVDIGYSGAQDTELYILESVVSLHGRGKWIGDFDVIKALNDKLLITRYGTTSQNDLTAGKAVPDSSQDLCDKGHERNYKQEDWHLIALENWMELLDASSKHSVFLAHGNWQARLAATAICVAQKRQVCILNDPVCWTCISLSFSTSSVVFIY